MPFSPDLLQYLHEQQTGSAVGPTPQSTVPIPMGVFSNQVLEDKAKGKCVHLLSPPDYCTLEKDLLTPVIPCIIKMDKNHSWL